MGFTYGRPALVLLVLASTLTIAMADKGFTANWNVHWPFKHDNASCQPKKVIVGGSDYWRFGTNYANWARKNGPFYVGDTLGIFIYKYHVICIFF